MGVYTGNKTGISKQQRYINIGLCGIDVYRTRVLGVYAGNNTEIPQEQRYINIGLYKTCVLGVYTGNKTGISEEQHIGLCGYRLYRTRVVGVYTGFNIDIPQEQCYINIGMYGIDVSRTCVFGFPRTAALYRYRLVWD